jgi:hypothetical protein
MPDNRDDLDRFLDSALATYADPGPDSGITQRILARVAAEPARRQSWRWLPWAVAAPVAAGLLSLFMLSGSKPVHRPTEGGNQARVVQPPYSRTGGERSTSNLRLGPARQAQVSRPHSKSGGPAIAVKTEPLPKLDVFPTPQPLSSEEQALVDYAAHATKSERQSLIDVQQQMDAPLTIAAITIQPLEPPKSDGN